MAEAQGYLKALLNSLRTLRQKARVTEKALEMRLILGPGWIRRFETGETVPSIDMLLAILHETKTNLADLVQALPEPEALAVERAISAEETGKDIIIHFRYAKYDAQYKLSDSTLAQFEAVITTLRNGLARIRSEDKEENETIKTEAVARAFLLAVRLWPKANPSDLWYFLIYRAYCDPYNHPARFARLDFAQSWKRTGGWALEVILARHYGPFLKKHDITLLVPDARTRQKVVASLDLTDRIEADKIDLVLFGRNSTVPVFFGVVHVKASFAERRTDDVPLSIALSKGGFTSPLWTMDCKSAPGVHPENRGELGQIGTARSAKRKDIEDEGYFTGCFSYNRNTLPSPLSLPAERRVYVCDFSNPDDAFSRFIISRWQAFPKS